MKVVVNEGQELYMWREVSAGTVKENQHISNIGGKQQVSQEQHKAIADGIAGLSWQMALKQSGSGGTAALSPAKKPDTLALTFQLPAGCEEALMEAVQAAGKLEKQSMPILGKMPPNNKYFMDCRAFLMEMNEHVHTANHWTQWKEKRDNTVPDRSDCDDLLMKVAQAVSNVNSGLEICKGWIRGQQ